MDQTPSAALAPDGKLAGNRSGGIGALVFCLAMIFLVPLVFGIGPRLVGLGLLPAAVGLATGKLTGQDMPAGRGLNRHKASKRGVLALCCGVALAGIYLFARLMGYFPW